MLETLVRRKVTTSMIFIGICLLGVISLDRLPLQLLPDIEFPMLTVVTAYENAAPSEIEQLVTQHIEEAVSSVNGVVSVYSESIEGLSLVTARFDWDVNMDMALVETKEKVDIIKGQLPQDTEKSIVVKLDPRADPIMIYSLVNKTGDFRRIRKRIEKEVVPSLERIDGVATVDISGGFRRQINVHLDSAKIYSHALSLREVMENINLANYNFPAGSIEKGNREYIVRTVGEFQALNEINRVVVGRNENGIPIYLDDIGTITDGYKDRKCIIRLNGNESVGLLIRKEPGKNTIETCNQVEDRIASLKDKYSGELLIRTVYDQSKFIRNSISNVFNSAIIGGIIAILVLWFFLKEVRSPVIIASSIPVSILGTIALMYFKGVSINTMSLGGLALGVGMMVDAGIVVLESIKRKRESADRKDKSPDPVLRIVAGTEEVKTAVIASTLTTIVVFLPIVFLSGLSGAVFGELALTISFALICSLVSSLLLMPMLSTVSVPHGGISGKLKSLQEKAFRLSDTVMAGSLRIYNLLIRYSLSNKRPVLIMGIAVCIFGTVLFLAIDTELMPRVDPGEFSIDIEAPKGTSLKESSALSMKVEQFLLKKSYVRYVYSKIGSDPEENIAERTSGRRTHNILLTVILKDDRSENIGEIVDSLKREIRFGEEITAEYRIWENVVAAVFSRTEKPLTIEIYGRDKEYLSSLGETIKKKIYRVAGVYNISSILDKGDPELKVEMDRNKMASLGVSIADVASTIRAAVHGEAVTRLREKDDEIDIRVRLREEDRTEKDSLYRILVKTETGAPVPIQKFSIINEGFGASKIIRSEQSRVNRITADIRGSRDAIFGDVEDSIDTLKIREGYEAKIVGEKDEIAKTFREMRFALLLAVVLIYMLLAAQFQSFRNPLIIMLSIPVTALGISGALFITGRTLNINSGIGIIMLAGVVVNNAIVLFDYIDRERSAGKRIEEAIISAGERRLKPILMTTATTIFALFPIALGIGQGVELQQPMAIAVIGGLTLSTLLTLVFIPTVYAMVHRELDEVKAPE